MEITTRGLWSLIHGIGFGALYLMAVCGLFVMLYRQFASTKPDSDKSDSSLSLRIYLLAMAASAWLSVLSGTYIVYPWYRASAPTGAANLAAFPRALLLSSPATRNWHLLGMEWKEHIAWLAPIAITMAAVIALQYGSQLRRHPRIRIAMGGFALGSLLAVGIAGFYGIMLDKKAPLDG